MRCIGGKISNYGKIRYLNIIFLLWWFWPIYSVLLEIIIPDRVVSYIGYLFFLLLFASALYINRGQIKRSFGIFVLLYIFLGIINIYLVTYWYYAVVEMGASLMKFIVPVYIFSYIDNADMEKIIFKWYQWGIAHTFLIPVIYVCMKRGIIGYGNVAVVTVSNIIILLIGFYIFSWNRLKGFFAFFANFIFLFLWGSRMPALATICVGIYLFAFWKRTLKNAKPVLLLLFSVIISLIFINIKEIVSFLCDYCISRGIDSRTITKFSQDIGNLSLIEMMKSSGRGYIWETTWDFLKNQEGLPGGFGVVRALTNGAYYFSHNIFLDLLVIFGIFTIPIIIGLLYQLYKNYYLFSKTNFILCTTYGLFFFICSLTGAHFLGDSYAIVFWGMLFFMEVKPNG